MNSPFFERIKLWLPTQTYTNHRIPGMLVTNKGTLLVYCEARRAVSDWALMDIIMQRSQDCGKTFSQPFLLAKGTQNHSTVNNPVMMQDNNGRIHFLYCEDYTINGGRALRRYSDDDGVTWSDPIDVTPFTNPNYHNVWAFGPGHGIVTGDGTLIVPAWFVPKHCNAPIEAHAPSVLTTFYSKDNGETWAVGDILESTSSIIYPNETVGALTSDGKVYLNIRFSGLCRAKAYSENGYSNWTEYEPDYKLLDPCCFGSVAVYNDKENPYTIIFGNCDSNTGRNHVTVKASVDNGYTFPISKLIDAERGGYVEVATDSKAKLIYLLYEEKAGENDYLVTFNYEWLLSEN